MCLAQGHNEVTPVRLEAQPLDLETFNTTTALPFYNQVRFKPTVKLLQGQVKILKVWLSIYPESE